MMRPRGVLCGDSCTRVLLAVLDGRRTYGELTAATGLGRASVARHLRRLARAGLVAWEPGRQGTLRPQVYTPHQ